MLVLTLPPGPKTGDILPKTKWAVVFVPAWFFFGIGGSPLNKPPTHYRNPGLGLGWGEFFFWLGPSFLAFIPHNS